MDIVKQVLNKILYPPTFETQSYDKFPIFVGVEKNSLFYGCLLSKTKIVVYTGQRLFVSPEKFILNTDIYLVIISDFFPSYSLKARYALLKLILVEALNKEKIPLGFLEQYDANSMHLCE